MSTLDAAVAETHISVLFFTGDRVYKLKKPIRTAFLDFSSPEARRQACLREVELNRRLAPDVYLGVADVMGPRGSGDPPGTPCDHLVVMRRMPPERRLSTLVSSAASGDPEGAAGPAGEAGAVVPVGAEGAGGAGGTPQSAGPAAAAGSEGPASVDVCLEQVARVVAGFHATAATSPEISAEGRRDAVRARWEANVAEMEPYVGLLPDPGVHDRIVQLARAYLAGREPLFDRRIHQGRIRDGHGDLLADDVFCLDAPRILDCLEFDDRLRYVDVLDDVSFLAMDLERLGGPGPARRFLDAYRNATGDDAPESLLHHYMAYRAHVRAKVACLRHEQGDEQALGEAAHLLELASRHLQAGRVALVLVGGLPGTGTSTLARMLADAHGWTVIRSDEVRRERACPPLAVPPPDEPPEEPAGASYGEGRYAPGAVEATYRALLGRARAALGMGVPVVLDASWTSAHRRSEAAELARDTFARLVALRCTVAAGVAAARIATRQQRGGDPSEATPDVARGMAADADPWPEAAEIDTSGTPGDSLARAEQALSRLPA